MKNINQGFYTGSLEFITVENYKDSFNISITFQEREEIEFSEEETQETSEDILDVEDIDIENILGEKNKTEPQKEPEKKKPSFILIASIILAILFIIFLLYRKTRKRSKEIEELISKNKK